MKEAPSAERPSREGREEQSTLLVGRAHFKDPVSNAAESWLASLSKALRGMRVYDANNKMLQRFLDKAEEDLKALHALAEEVTFTVREDRLLYASTIGGVVRVEGAEVIEDRCRPEDIVAQVARKLTPLREAYEAALERNQTLAGEIILSFLIEDGRPRQQEVLDNPIEDPAVAAALTECLNTWLWPGKSDIVATIRLGLKPVRREDPVHVDADREEGIPFAFYRNGFRKLTFVRGFDLKEMTQFLRALQSNFGDGGGAVGEDLVSTLWRLDLPSFRYLTIDGLTIGTATGTREQENESEEIDRLQADIDNLVAQIYAQQTKTDVAPDDIVKGASITRDDLTALENIRLETAEDLDMLDLVTARGIADIARVELEPLYAEIQGADREVIVPQLIDSLVCILYDTMSSQDIARKLELIQQLFDGLLLRGGFLHATLLVDRIRERAEQSRDLKTAHIAHHVLAALATEARVSQVLALFNDAMPGGAGAEVIGFLRRLGPPVVKPLIEALDGVASPMHRRLLCELIVDLQMPPASVVQAAVAGAKWFVVVDLLGLVARLDPADQAAILRRTAENENPKVRAQTIAMLRGFPEGGADDLIAAAVRDPEIDVRIAASRAAAARHSRKGGQAIGEWLKNDAFFRSEPREMNAMMLAFATIGGHDAVSTLDKILNPGLFSGKTDAQVAAAIALSSIPREDARQSLQRGMRTLSSKIREACRQGLARSTEESGRSRSHESTTARGFDPFAGAGLSIDLPAAASTMELEMGLSDGLPAGKREAELPMLPPPPDMVLWAPPSSTAYERASSEVQRPPSSPPPAAPKKHSSVPPAPPQAPAPRPSFIVRSRGASDVLPPPRSSTEPRIAAPSLPIDLDLGLDDTSPVPLDAAALRPIDEVSPSRAAVAPAPPLARAPTPPPARAPTPPPARAPAPLPAPPPAPSTPPPAGRGAGTSYSFVRGRQKVEDEE